MQNSVNVFIGSTLFWTGPSASKAKAGPGDPFISPRFQVRYLPQTQSWPLDLRSAHIKFHPFNILRFNLRIQLQRKKCFVGRCSMPQLGFLLKTWIVSWTTGPLLSLTEVANDAKCGQLWIMNLNILFRDPWCWPRLPLLPPWCFHRPQGSQHCRW